MEKAEYQQVASGEATKNDDDEESRSTIIYMPQNAIKYNPTEQMQDPIVSADGTDYRKAEAHHVPPENMEQDDRVPDGISCCISSYVSYICQQIPNMNTINCNWSSIVNALPFFCIPINTLVTIAMFVTMLLLSKGNHDLMEKNHLLEEKLNNQSAVFNQTIQNLETQIQVANQTNQELAIVNHSRCVDFGMVGMHSFLCNLAGCKNGTFKATPKSFYANKTETRNHCLSSEGWVLHGMPYCITETGNFSSLVIENSSSHKIKQCFRCICEGQRKGHSMALARDCKLHYTLCPKMFL